MKILVYFVGRPRDVHSNALAQEFAKRTKRYFSIEMQELQPARFDRIRQFSAAFKVMLDPAGLLYNSEQFTELVRKAEFEARDLLFLLGGHDGLPSEWKAKADLLLSLSPLTMPHELARAVLLEQIYRAVTTLRGHPYPR